MYFQWEPDFFKGFDSPRLHHNCTPILIHCVSGLVCSLFLHKHLIAWLSQYYITITGFAAVYLAQLRSLFLFSTINLLTKGRYRVHNLILSSSKVSAATLAEELRRRHYIFSFKGFCSTFSLVALLGLAWILCYHMEVIS